MMMKEEEEDIQIKLKRVEENSKNVPRLLRM